MNDWSGSFAVTAGGDWVFIIRFFLHQLNNLRANSLKIILQPCLLSPVNKKYLAPLILLHNLTDSSSRVPEVQPSPCEKEKLLLSICLCLPKVPGESPCSNQGCLVELELPGHGCQPIVTGGTKQDRWGGEGQRVNESLWIKETEIPIIWSIFTLLACYFPTVYITPIYSCFPNWKISLAMPVCLPWLHM